MNQQNEDLRWTQRLTQYGKALAQLQDAVAESKKRPLSRLERQGLVKAFEFSHELAWNVMKDFFEHQGTQGLMGSRDATREAFSRGLITDGDTWMAMIKSRNMTAHTYNDETAKAIEQQVCDAYLPLLLELREAMQALASAP